ncbi:hypothetical protein [Belliella baltica]|nr:hypothetical protein [Belliella baltica]
MKKLFSILMIMSMSIFIGHLSAQDAEVGEPSLDGPGCIDFGQSMWTSSGPLTKDRTFYNCFCGKESGIAEQACK